MRNLLQLFMRFRGFLMFLILEGVCFFLIVNFNQYQHRIFLSSSNDVFGTLHNWGASTRRYFSLGVENEDLLTQNAQLKNDRDSLLGVISKLKEPLQDTFPASIPEDDSIRHVFRFIGANIINNSIFGTNNIITLNKGRKDSVKAHSGVVNSNGLVGVVLNTSENYSIVMSLLHQQTRISAKIGDGKHFGTLVWRGKDTQIMHLEAVPNYAFPSIKIGDDVVTSGFSFKFPPQIKIGKVSAVEESPRDNFLDIEVKLVNELDQVNHAYICIFEGKAELEALEQNSKDE